MFDQQLQVYGGNGQLSTNLKPLHPVRRKIRRRSVWVRGRMVCVYPTPPPAFPPFPQFFPSRQPTPTSPKFPQCFLSLTQKPTRAYPTLQQPRNFFVFEAILVPFEITACNVIIHYWSDIVPAGGIIALVIVLYALINLLAVKWYGETEFWAALGKVLLIVGLIIFTFITMLGGNPLGDRFGFRYWKNPGSFKPLYYEGSLGRWLGFLQCLIQASFTIAGPDYVSMAAGEAENPRVVMPKAYNAVFYRLTTFFILGALCVGINVPYNDQELTAAFANDEPGAAASPYVSLLEMSSVGIVSREAVIDVCGPLSRSWL